MKPEVRKAQREQAIRLVFPLPCVQNIKKEGREEEEEEKKLFD